MNEIKNEISNIAVLAASKVIEKDIDSNKHKELIDNFIKERYSSFNSGIGEKILNGEATLQQARHAKWLAA